MSHQPAITASLPHRSRNLFFRLGPGADADALRAPLRGPSIREAVDPLHRSIWISEGTNLDYLRVFDGHHLYNIAWSADPRGTVVTWSKGVREKAIELGSFKYFVGTAMPQDSTLPTVLAGQHFEGLENFFRTICVRNDDRMVFLCDRKLDPQVIAAICGVARARGVKPWVIMSDTTQHTSIPDEVRPILEKATFVVSSWFCSIMVNHDCGFTVWIVDPNGPERFCGIRGET